MARGKDTTRLTVCCLEERLAPAGIAGPPVEPDVIGLYAPAERAAAGAFVRVNQVGYLTGAIKQARLMASGSEVGATFRVLDAGGTVVFTGTVGADLGSWSADFPNVYLLDFSDVTTPGTYHIEVTGPINASSPSFRVDTGANLYMGLLSNASTFYQAQRDGEDVNPAVLDRQPSHLTDENAFVYRKPRYVGSILQGGLERIGGPIDVSGGWFDAGDFLKFVETASYTVIGMLMAVRDHPDRLTGGNADFAAEARFGLDWLLKMWDDANGVLYYQVGIGTGNGGNILGEYDVPFHLPEEDDQQNTEPGDPEFFVEFRPVFRANAPGNKISPNLAGRMAAAFALGSQVFRASDPAYADRLLLAGQHVFDLAKTRFVTKLLTVSPFAAYAEIEWRDDIELGATELFFATSAANLPAGLPHTDPSFYLQKAAKFAGKYINSPTGNDDLTLYDVAALAHYELHHAITAASNPGGLAVTQDDLLESLKAPLDRGVVQAAQDPFAFGVSYESGADKAPTALGFALTASLYKELTGDGSYDAFAANQLDWVLGENAWGSSFIIGAGSTFPHCPHHQVANLAGALDGTSPILLGAVVNGPGRVTDFQNLEEFGAGARACPSDGSDPFAMFSGQGARYRDNVDAFRSTEPADDYAALTPLLFARLVDGVPAPLAASSRIDFQNQPERTAPAVAGVGVTAPATDVMPGAYSYLEPDCAKTYHRLGRGESE